MPVIGVITPEAHAAVLATRNRRDRPARDAAARSTRGRYAELVHALDAGVGVLARRVPAARAADRGRRPVRRGDGGGRARVRGAAEGGGRRHGHPRLHALPADPPDLPARVRPRRDARLLGRGDGARGGGDARAQGHRERRRRATARTASSRPAIPAAFREMGRRFLQLPIGEVEHVTLAQLEVLLHDARGRAPARRAAPADDRARLPREPARLGADHAGEDEGALHGDGAGGGAALAAQQGPRLDDRGVLAAAGVDRRPRRARGVARQAAGAHDRDPAADRARAARGRRLPGARRAHAVARLRRAAGRRRHALRRDLRRVRRGAGARSTASASPARSSTRSPRSRSASSTACRCSTSTTPRTRTPTPT